MAHLEIFIIIAVISADVLFTDDYCLDGGSDKVENYCQGFVSPSAGGSCSFLRR